MSEEIKFEGHNVFLGTFKSNRDSFRVEIDLGRDQYDKVKDIPMLPSMVYEVVITPKVEE